MLEIFGGRFIPSSSGAFVHSLRDVPVRRPLRTNTEDAKDAPTQIFEAHLAQAGPDVVLALRAPGAAEPRTHRAGDQKHSFNTPAPGCIDTTRAPMQGETVPASRGNRRTPILLDTV